MLINKNDETFYKIYILVSNYLSKENRSKLNKHTWLEKGCSIEILKVEDSLFSEANLTSYLTVPTFYRLLIPELLLNYNKCLYLDCDLLVLSDLSKLYNTDMTDYYIAGVPDCEIIKQSEKNKEHIEKLEIPSAQNYINAGVLVMNLEIIRKKQINKDFLNHISKNYPIPDQDILNKCCYGYIKILSPKFNLFRTYYKSPQSLNISGLSLTEIEEAAMNPIIIHYVSEFKPWNNMKMNATALWYEYAELELDRKDFDAVCEKAKKLTEELDFSLSAIDLRKYSFAIFGYTSYGYAALNHLINKGAANIIGFCDNDVKKQGLSYHGYEVLSLTDILSTYDNLVFIIALQKQYQAVEKQLIEAGIRNENIVRYRFKPKTYYVGLLPEYYTTELNSIMLKEFGISDWTFDKVNFIAELEKDKYKSIIKQYWMEDWILRR